MLEAYEEEVLMRLYDNGLIAMRYCAIQKVANIIKWQDLDKKYKVQKSFPNVVRKLATKGYVDEHGKSGDVISLTRFGVLYVKGKTSKKN
jgi:hypothetical protein